LSESELRGENRRVDSICCIQGGNELDVCRIVFGGIYAVWEVRDNRNGSISTREVRDNTKTGYSKLRLGSVKFCDNI
jgi:hypothetical protein